MDEHRPPSACAGVAVHYAEVSVPVRLKPEASVEYAGVEGCGEPSVTVRQSAPSDPSCCCEVVIDQSVRITLKIAYSADADAGEPCIRCTAPAPPPPRR